MNASDYERGTQIKLRAVEPGDMVYIGTHPYRVTAKCQTPDEWYELSFEDVSMKYAGRGDVLLARAVLRMDPPVRTYNGLPTKTGELARLQAKVDSQADELLKLEEQHAHDLTRCRTLEAQVRAQEKAIRTQLDTIQYLRAGLEAIKHMARSVEE